MGPKNRGRPRLDRPLRVDYEDGPLAPSPVDGLFTATQRRILRFIFGEPDHAFCVRELRDVAGCGAGATQRELHRLARAGLVSVAKDGTRMLVQANPCSPIHAELTALVRKTVGLAEPLREALSAVAWRIDFAFAFEPERDPEGPRYRSLGLMLVADRLDTLGHDLLIARNFAEHLVGRSIFMLERTPASFASDWFVAQVLRRPRVWVIGSDESLRAAGR